MPNMSAEAKQQLQVTLERGIDRAERRLIDLRAIERVLSVWRLLTFGAGAVLVLLAWGLASLPLWIGAAVLFVGFAVLVARYRRITALIAAFEAWIVIKRTHIARMRLDWRAIPTPKALAPLSDDHPFALDLDLIGTYSIHRLLDTTNTRNAAERLRAWLLSTTPDLGTTQRRAALVRELTPLSAFRDRLYRAGSDWRGRDGDTLLSWLHAHATEDIPVWVIPVLIVWAAVNVGLLISGFTLAIISVAVYLFVSNLYWRRLGDLFGDALAIQAQVRALREVFGYLETYQFADRSRLRDLTVPFADAARKPSSLLRRIGWIAGAASIRGNFFLWLPLNSIFPWDIVVGYLLTREKRTLAEQLPRWLAAWYELEALSALANFAHLHPHYTFPTLDPAAQPFAGVGIGHPLIDEDVKVRNDYAVDELGAVTIITGSNMAGKSSFLRALGVNLALANAGSVVDAHELRAIPLRLFSCIRVSDSVVDGFSYFYAEVRRLKALLDALQTDNGAPLFYLIDEIFRGTNNRERLIGARSFIREAAGQRGIGLIATHDLELVKLADESPSITNQHFREQVIDGRLAFDYKLRPGASPTTNALTIMRLAGLPVESSG